MERDNQKEKLISIEQAKEILRKAASKITANGKRYVWIGDNVVEYRNGYLIPVSFPPMGVDKPSSYLRAWVDYTTGEVLMGFDVTA